MNKVICDICGTAYPDTAPKCPICGFAKTATETTSAGSERRTSESYAAVKGGRFSKQNVRKRTNSSRNPERGNSDRPRRNEKEESGNTGLVLVVIFLLVAIVAVVIYIGLKLFRTPDADVPQPSGTSQVTLPTTTPTDPEATIGNGIACERLEMHKSIEFFNIGDTWPLEVRPTPANTTDEITFESSAPEIVTVDETGLLTAVGSGEATITVTCGAITEVCQIKCSFENSPTDPTTDPTAPTDPTATTTPTEPAGPVDPNFTFEFNTKWKDGDKWDTSILELGETWKAYKTNLSVDPGAITWTSDDPSVCTIQNGIVTGVGPGKTEVHATYGGKTYTCIVRCKFETTGTGTETTPTEPNTQEPTVPGDVEFTFEFNTPFTEGDKWDTTIQKQGETWKAYKTNLSVDPSAITWTTDDPDVCTVKDGIVTAEGPGKTEIHATYGGKTYTCIVRVKGE
jgi:hypothetical protein